MFKASELADVVKPTPAPEQIDEWYRNLPKQTLEIFTAQLEMQLLLTVENRKCYHEIQKRVGEWRKKYRHAHEGRTEQWNLTECKSPENWAIGQANQTS